MKSSNQPVPQPLVQQSTGAAKSGPISSSSEFDSLWHSYVKEDLSMKKFLVMIANINSSLSRNHQSLVTVTETKFKGCASFDDLRGVLRALDGLEEFQNIGAHTGVKLLLIGFIKGMSNASFQLLPEQEVAIYQCV